MVRGVAYLEKTASAIALSLILALIVLSIFYYITYLENVRLKNKIEMLTEENRELGVIKEEYEKLLQNYTKLVEEYNEAVKTIKEYEHEISVIKTLSVIAFRDKLMELASKINERVYGGKNFIRPNEVENVVNNIIGHKFNEETLGRDLYQVFSYVMRTIKYSKDSIYPVIREINVSVEDTTYNITVELDWITEVYQTPSETLERGEGDCEDMAYLAASIIQNYLGENKDYEVYVLQVVWDGGGHAAVVVRHRSGTIAIIDPAGKYYTGRVNVVKFDNARDELLKWFKYWGINEYNFKRARFVSIIGEAYVDSIESAISFLD